MNKKSKTYIALPILVLTAIFGVAGLVSAKDGVGFGVRETFEEKGITLEQWRAKTPTEKLEIKKQYLQALVTRGKITQTQADARLKFMQEKQDKKGGSGSCQCMMGGGEKTCQMNQGIK